LEEVPEVSTVERLEQEGLGEEFVKVRMVSKDNVDIRENVFFALAQSRLPIMEMHHLEKSLEDIFLELTEEETTDAGNL
jgi:ABC-2 type transport system ATP-binding protein